MVTSRASTLIAADPEQLFDFVAVRFATNYRRWSPEVQQLEFLTPGPLRVGSRARQLRMDQGRRSDTSFKVVTFEPPRLIAFAEVSNQFYTHYEIAPDPLGSLLNFGFELRRIDLYMRPFEKLIRVAIQEGAERVVRNIKGLVEREAAAARAGQAAHIRS